MKQQQQQHQSIDLTWPVDLVSCSLLVSYIVIYLAYIVSYIASYVHLFSYGLLYS